MTTYRELLDRQHFMQLEGLRYGQTAPNDLQLHLAYVTECGELNQTLKPLWVWWKKPGMTGDIDRARVLDEAADVLHFALIRQLREHFYEPGDDLDSDYDRPVGDLRAHSYHSDLFAKMPTAALSRLTTTGDFQPRVSEIIALLVIVVSAVGATADDLIRAYFDKTEVNLRRWHHASLPARQVSQVVHEWAETLSGEPEPVDVTASGTSAATCRRMRATLAYNPDSKRHEAVVTIAGVETLLIGHFPALLEF